MHVSIGIMLIDDFQLRETERRYAERERQRQRSLRLIKDGRYLQADTPERVESSSREEESPLRPPRKS